MANLLKKQSHTAHLAKTAFNMGKTHTFTSSVGMILPVYQDILNVGETVYINSQLIARSQPLVTAAMADIHFNVDWFFVPLSMIYTLFPSLRYKTNDMISENFLSSSNPNVVNTGLPIFNIDDCLYGSDGPAVPASQVISAEGLGARFGAWGAQAFRLADMLGFNPRAAILSHTEGRVEMFNPNVFPWQALAYQCIYQDYFRDDDWEKRVIQSFNVDGRHTTPLTPASEYFRGIFALRFHRRYNDYYNVTKSQPYLNAVNLIGDTVANNVFGVPSVLLNYFSDAAFADVTDPSGMQRSLGPGQKGDVDYPSFVGAMSYSIDQDTYSTTADLRTAFAIEKLYRLIGMSKKDYDHQVLAHFGFKVPHDVKHELTHIMSQSAIMHIGEVIASADTFDGENGSALGAVGGKGYAIIEKNKHAKKFTAPVDGVLMAVTYAVPELSYYDTLDKCNSITTMNDFFTPEFDNLGAQPLMSFETVPFSDSTNSGRLGWQPRFMQWKMKQNRASFAFYHNNTAYGVNTYSPWVLSERPLGVEYQVGVEPASLTFQSFLCAPTDINNIMQVPFVTAWSDSFKESPWLIYQTDPFIEHFRADVKKVSTMSPTGEPDLNGI